MSSPLSMKGCITICCFIWMTQLCGQVSLPAIFSDHMVLQQQSQVLIWGWANQGDEIRIKTSWNKKTYRCKADNAGNWNIKVETTKAGGPYSIEIHNNEPMILNDIFLGEVWLCAGQSNMEMPMKGFMGQPVLNSNETILKSSNPLIRVITVPRNSKTEPQKNFKGGWKVASPSVVSEFSATGYYFGRLINELIDVPIGLINVSYGGSCIEAWMSKETSQQFEEFKIPESTDSIKSPNRTPTVLFNGMLHPVVGYGIRGVIWYQGETNYRNASDYTRLFQSMVSEWRNRWNQGDFPFYYCQVAPFNYDSLTLNEISPMNNSALLRDAQRKAMKVIPNCGMVVLLDQGEEMNIHPANKKTAGERLAYWALAKDYHIEGFAFASPEFHEVHMKDSVLTVTFNNIPNGITSFGKEVTQFEIAGQDKLFYPARCELRRKSVVLSSPEVKKPVHVRYAFKNFVTAEIFSTEGLPLSSFRTDEWND